MIGGMVFVNKLKTILANLIIQRAARIIAECNEWNQEQLSLFALDEHDYMGDTLEGHMVDIKMRFSALQIELARSLID